MNSPTTCIVEPFRQRYVQEISMMVTLPLGMSRGTSLCYAGIATHPHQ